MPNDSIQFSNRMTRGDLRRQLITLFEQVSDVPDRDADILIEAATGVSAFDWVLNHSENVTKNQLASVKAVADRRLDNEPVAYIVGHQPFWTLDIEVSRDTLIPRTDSEALIILAKRSVGIGADKILDLGTGTGCLLLAALSEFRGATGIGVDIAPGAAELAARNASRNTLASRAAFRTGSWFEPLRQEDGPFDLILSNPPYIQDGTIKELMVDVKDFEPASALTAGPTGLEAYDEILRQAESWLKPDGRIIFEVGFDQSIEVQELAKTYGYACISQEKDLGGHVRGLCFAFEANPA